MLKKAIIFIGFAIILFVFSYYVRLWSYDFVDSCCSGLCGRCPPSFWECSFMGYVAFYQIFMGTALLVLGLFEIMEVYYNVKKQGEIRNGDR